MLLQASLARVPFLRRLPEQELSSDLPNARIAARGLVCHGGLGEHFPGHLDLDRSMTTEAEIEDSCTEKVQLVLPVVERAGINPSLCFHVASLPPTDGFRFEGPEAYLCCDEQSSDFGKVFILEDDNELETPTALSEIQQGFGDFVQEEATNPFYWSYEEITMPI